MSSNNNPWLGLKTYSEGQILYGRSEEISALSQDILFNRQTVVYGKSGIGKSSLLNAGVFPILRRSNMFPVNVRLVHNEIQANYFEQIKKCVEESLQNLRREIVGTDGRKQTIDKLKGEKIELCEAIPNDGGESLWEYFHRHKFINDQKEEIQPVIVFDQFEEIFTLCKDEETRRYFFDQLADLINDIPPSYIYASTNKREDDRVDNEVIDGYEDIILEEDDEDDQTYDYLQESKFHIVITLREEFLSYLERYTTNIPLLKHNRYCLRPLSDDQAGVIITDPVPGLISEDVAVEIICKITDSKPTDFKLGDGKAQLEVDSVILSLFLSELYKKKAPEEDSISIDLVRDSGDNIISSFYEETIKGISEKSVEYLEKELITDDKCRDSIFEKQAISNGVTKKELDYLKEERLIHEFPWNNTGMRIEYMHDKLCPVIVERRKRRELQKLQEEEERKREAEEDARREKERLQQEEERKKLEEEKKQISHKKSRNRRFALLLSATAIVLIVIAIVIISMYVKNEKQRNELDALNSEIRTILPSVIEQQIKDGDSYNAGKLLLKLFPDTLYAAEDPIRISLLRELSGCKSTIHKGHSRSVNIAVFSKDESFAITGSDDMTVRIWDSMTGSLISTVNLGSPVMSLAISPDDQKMIVSTKDGYIRTFSITHGNTVLQDSLAQESYARFVTYNPNGSEVFACNTNGNLLVCNSSNLSQNKTYKISNKGATCISFSKDGLRMAIAGTDNTIMIWDATQLTSLYTLLGHKDWVRSVDFSSDGDRLVSCSDDMTVRLWNLRSRNCTIVQELPDWGTKASFSPNGKRIISSCRDGALRTIDVATLCEMPSFQIKHSGSLNRFDLSRDGSRVITCSTDTDVHVWDYGNPMDTGVSIRLSGAVYGLSVLYGTNRIAVVTNNGTLGVWNAETGSNIWKKEREVGRVTSLKVSPNGKMIALSAGSKIRLFRSENGEELEFNNTGGHRGWIRNLCFNHSGNTLASVGDDKSIILWDMDTRKFKKQIFGHTSSVYAIDFSKDDRKIVTGSNDMTIRQWDTASGKQIGTPITGHKNVVLSVRYNSNDSLILSSSGDQTACLWKTDGTLVNHFVGASGYMSDAIFGLTEDEIITASADKYIRIWCSQSGKETVRLGGHFGGVSRLVLSKDGILVSSDNIGGINVWKIPNLKTTADDLVKKYNIVDEQ